MSEIEIEIDGQKLMAKPNQTVIQVADDAGIYIPRFCYHKLLTIPANCRMCLVEVEKAPKPLPACATPVAPNMKIFTKSQKTLAAQRSVMEYLLINHPLDCPICDQGGECELQDLSMGYGTSWSQYTESKRSVADQNLGPLIATEMTRCIYCTRCVRFGEEVAGLRELGAIGRGEFTEISTYIQHAIKSEISGNIVDLCPVGALTNKPYRFTSRPWELDQASSISPHDCVGSNLHVHSRYGKVMRVVSRENMQINETWISDRDRYSFTGLYHADRLKHPMVRVEGEWRELDWQHAFMHAAAKLQETLEEYGADEFGALAHPSSTLEEFYLLQKFMRALKSPHIDYRLRECDTSDQTHLPLFPGFNLGAQSQDSTMTITDVAHCDAILIIGSNIQKEAPMLSVQVRKAALKGAKVLLINSVDYPFTFPIAGKQIVAPHLLAKALTEINLKSEFKDKKNICVLLGAQSLHHVHAATIRYLADQIAQEYSAKLGLITDGSNSAGGWLAGAIPHREMNGTALDHHGLSAYEMLLKPRKAYLLLNVEPDFDCANAKLAVTAMQEAKFIIALSTYRNSVLEAEADVILPMSPFTETSGTFINVTGVSQTFNQTAKPFEQSRPGWKILSVLGRFMLLDNFEFDESAAIKKEFAANIKSHEPNKSTALPQPKQLSGDVGSDKKLSRIGEIPIYALDGLVRRAKPLQETQAIMEGDVSQVRMHPETAAKLQLKNGEKVTVKQSQYGDHNPAGIASSSLKLALDTRVAKGAAWVAGGIAATRELGDLFAEIEITSAGGGV